MLLNMDDGSLTTATLPTLERQRRAHTSYNIFMRDMMAEHGGIGSRRLSNMIRSNSVILNSTLEEEQR